MAERQFDFYRDDDSIGTLQILAVPVVGGGGGGSGTDDRVDLINGSATYPLMSVTKATVSGVSGVIWKYDDGTTDGLNVFVADGTGLNTVKSAIEAELSDVVSAEVTGHAGSTVEQYESLTINNRDGTTSVINVAPVDTSTGKLRTANLPVKSTITASDTNPVNSVAVALYAQPLTDKVSVSGTSVTQALDADKMYVFGEVTALTVTLNAPSDSSHVHEYHFRFTSGTTATSLSLPSSVTMPSDFTVEASKTYEISIVDGYGAYVAW